MLRNVRAFANLAMTAWWAICVFAMTCKQFLALFKNALNLNLALIFGHLIKIIVSKHPAPLR